MASLISVQGPLFQYQATTVPEYAQFKVATINEGLCSLSSYNRRDFFKISLITKGNSELFYANRGIKINRPALVFTNRLVPYAWEANDAEEASGYFCVFTEEFLQAGGRMESLQESSLYKPGGNPVYFLNDAQVGYIESLFARMRNDVDSEYVYKYEMLRSQLMLIIHEAIKMQPASAFFPLPNAASRITKLFLNLLENQYPVESAQHKPNLKKASDYADKLSVHVNHLNAAVQGITGKSTTMHLNERTLAEAKSLLIHTTWSVGEIAYSLGFEYASYFNNFFKKLAGITPLAYRKII
ncbi:helix-turn-helix domain-containing protein [Mucilaginibacter terrae]|uniref:helix-turn-helix domain-containing protein n=1 Tax=Mucilaginibacter terrae TaxID=1955052 RepID=UPI00363C49CA